MRLSPRLTISLSGFGEDETVASSEYITFKLGLVSLTGYATAVEAIGWSPIRSNITVTSLHELAVVFPYDVSCVTFQ